MVQRLLRRRRLMSIFKNIFNFFVRKTPTPDGIPRWAHRSHLNIYVFDIPMYQRQKVKRWYVKNRPDDVFTETWLRNNWRLHQINRATEFGVSYYGSGDSPLGSGRYLLCIDPKEKLYVYFGEGHQIKRS